MSDLWKHQLEAVEKAKKHGNLAIFFPTGTGKTRVAIEILRHHFNQNKRVMRTLILTPLTVCEQFRKQILKFSQIPSEKVFALTQSGDKRCKEFQKAVSNNALGCIIVTNYDAITSIKKFWAEIEKWAPEIIIADESHRLKNHKSKRFKGLMPTALAAKFRYGMTGSPVLQDERDLWAQFRFIFGDDSPLGKNYFEFQGRYFYDAMPRNVPFPKWVVKQGAQAELRSIVANCAVQAKKEECIDLPELLKVEVPVVLGSEQMQAYLEMRQHFITRVLDKEVTAQMVITQSIRLQQILAGFLAVSSDDEDVKYFENNPRLEMCLELVEDIVAGGDQVIIWTSFRPSYKMFANALTKLKIPHGFITGDESAKEKQKTIDDVYSGKIKVVISNPACGGTGIELSPCSYSIYYTRTYSLEHHIQSEGRNYRHGVSKKVTHYDIYVPDTIDEAVMKALKNKEDVAASLLNWAKQQ